MKKLRAFREERINFSGPPRRLKKRKSVRANVVQEKVNSDEVSSVNKLSPEVLVRHMVCISNETLATT